MNGLYGLCRPVGLSLGFLVAFGAPVIAQLPDVPPLPETIPVAGAEVAPPCPACETPAAPPKPPEKWHG